MWQAHLWAFLHVYSLFVFVHHGLGTNIAEASDVRNVFNLRGFSKHYFYINEWTKISFQFILQNILSLARGFDKIFCKIN